MTGPLTLPEIEEIAGKLTKAQREAMFRLDRHYRFLGLASRPDTCHPVIERWSKPAGGFNYRLTPAGQQVRDYLSRQP